MKPIRETIVDQIRAIATALGEFNEQAVFVGGAVVGFYLPSSLSGSIRPTEDIDIVVERALHPLGRREAFERSLREKGFRNDTSEGAPLCRWLYQSIVVDIMSADEKALGFSNRWYADGMMHAREVNVGRNTKVRILSAPYFIATKIEAFKDRGRGDFIASADIEDIISILDSASSDELEQRFTGLDKKLSSYLAKELNALLNSRGFLDALPSAVFDRVNGFERAVLVENRIRDIVRTLLS